MIYTNLVNFVKIHQENAKNRIDNMKSVELQSHAELRAFSDQFDQNMAELKQENTNLNNRLKYLETALVDLKSSNSENYEAKVRELEEFKALVEYYKQELANWDTIHRSKLESEIQTYRSILNTQLKTMKTDSYVSYQVVKPSETIVQTGKLS